MLCLQDTTEVVLSKTFIPDEKRKIKGLGRCCQTDIRIRTVSHCLKSDLLFKTHTHTLSTILCIPSTEIFHPNTRREVRKPNSCNIPAVLLACVCDNCSISTLAPFWPFLLLDELMPTRLRAQGTRHLQTKWTVAFARCARPSCGGVIMIYMNELLKTDGDSFIATAIKSQRV